MDLGLWASEPLGLALAPEVFFQSRKLLVKQDVSDLIWDGGSSVSTAAPEVEVSWPESCSAIQSPRSIAQEAFDQRRGVTGGWWEGRRRSRSRSFVAKRHV